MRTYTTPKVEAIWQDSTTMILWHTLEVAILGVQGAAGVVPKQWWKDLAAAGEPDVLEWKAAQLETGHELVAFLRAVNMPHMHIGVTSSDITDTALAMRIKLGNELIWDSALGVMGALDALRESKGHLAQLGRTHGQAAVPSTFDHRLAVLQGQVGRCMLTPEVPGKISGPVGTYRTIAVSREIEHEVLSSLDLTCPCPDEDHQPVSSQIVPRDYLSRWAWAVADLLSAYGAVAMEIRLLSHSGVGEVAEGRGDGYVGSSAMPHKRNPNQSERLTGLARIGRAAAFALSEGIEQWHDRDLAHSSVERVMVPELMGLAVYAGELLASVLENLQIDEARMSANLWAARQEAEVHERMVDAQLAGNMSYFEAAKYAVATKEGN